jgi:hypothetical protein
MEYHITELLDCLEDAGQDLKPRGGSAARVRARTLARLHGAEEGPARAVKPVRRRFRPAAILAAALAAILLLGGSVFAAWRLGAFRFAEEFGPVGEVLDSHAQSYKPAPDDEAAIPADFGYADWVKAQLGDYNLYLFELSAKDGTLRAWVRLTAREESVPAYRDSGLTLSFLGYETEAARSESEVPWMDTLWLSAPLDGPLAEDAEIVFCLTGPGRLPALATFPLDAMERNSEELTARVGPHYATAAQTKDFRFSLRSLTASPSAIYAVMDVKALTDWGAAHMDFVPELAVTNRTSQVSGHLTAPKLIASEEGLRRYLIGFSSSQPHNHVGDSISFELLEIHEEGDTMGHPYYLFDVELESLVPGAVTFSDPLGEPTDHISWQTVSVDPINLCVTGVRGEEAYGLGCPVITLIFRDGTRETVLYDWQQEEKPTTDHFADNWGIIGQRDGTVRASMTFSQPLDPADLAAVLVDGQEFTLPAQPAP